MAVKGSWCPPIREMMDYQPAFLDYVRFSQGRSNNTVQTYSYALTSFIEWAKSVNLEVEKARPMDIDDFFIWLRKEKGNASRSVNHKRSCLNMFYKWLLQKNLSQGIPWSRLTE